MGPGKIWRSAENSAPHRDSIPGTYILWRLVVPHRRNLAYNNGGDGCNVYNACLPYKPVTKMSLCRVP